MSFNVKWENKTDWSTWTNESTNGRLPRIVSNSLKLPFDKVSHIGTGSASSEFISRWSWGQRQRTEYNQPYLLNSDLANDNDILDPTIPANLGHSVSVSSGNNEICEYGYNSLTQNSYLRATPNIALTWTAFRTYMSCWIKSNIIDYSSVAKSIIATTTTLFGFSETRCAIVIDSNNKIKGVITDYNGGQFYIPPVGGDVVIDNNWHHILFATGVEYVPLPLDDYAEILVVDNNWGNGPQDTVHNIYHSGGDSILDIASSGKAGETQFGFCGIVDELTISKWSGNNRITTLIQNGQNSIEDIFLSYSPSYRHATNTFWSDVVDTERNNNLLIGIYTEYEAPNNSSIEFSFRASDSIFTKTSTTVEWSGFTSPGQISSGQDSGLSDLGVYIRGRYQQAKIRLSPSTIYSSDPDPLQLETPSVQSIELRFGDSNSMLSASVSCFEPGSVIGQIINFSGDNN